MEREVDCYEKNIFALNTITIIPALQWRLFQT